MKFLTLSKVNTLATESGCLWGESYGILTWSDKRKKMRLLRDILDLHTHTLASGHAYNTIWEMAKHASENGVELLGITEHAPMMPGSCHEFYFANLKVLPRELYGIHVLFGVELNIIDKEGNVDLDESILSQMDVAIASLHVPCFAPGSLEENTQAYLNAMKNPLIHIIGHPDDGRYPIDHERLVLGAKEHHVLLEVNNNSLNPRGVRKDTAVNDRKILEYCKKYEVPVIMGSDAHVMTEIKSHERVQALMKELDFPEKLVVNRSLDALREFIRF